MAFWGVEVKPGKPVIHSCEKARGRLRISQATLGISDATKKSIVQCNVGKKSPVLLCALLPNQTESCHLDLEFEEADDVVFSVIGPRSVYLTGYYVRQSQQCSPHSDSESYGVDIQDSQTEESSCRSDDDEYEDSFIDDDEHQDFSPSPVSSGKVADETESENENPNKTKCHGRRLKKNCQVVESDDASSHHSEDEENYPNNGQDHRRRLKKNRQIVESDDASSHHSEDEENDNPNNGKGHRRQLKKSHVVVESDDASPHHSEDKDGYLLSIFKSKKRTEKTASTGVEANNVNQKDQMHSLGCSKPKKKRKERSKKEKACEFEIDEGNSVHREDKLNEVEASKNLDIEVCQPVTSPESDSGKCRKSKKRRKLQLEGTFTEEIDVRSKNVSKHSVQVANEDQEQHIDNDVSIISGPLDNATKIEKKIKKTKKKKNRSNGESEMGLPDTAYNQETTPVKSEILTPKTKPTQNRTLSNGLIIEEVATGPPDGKVASRGKKVKVFYTAMLKENGRVYDSNVGKSPYKFRLGNEGAIDGWNLGIEGMHVGDKRRLIVPPSMGPGKHGAGENVPPDSWLVYDVELAGVYN